MKREKLSEEKIKRRVEELLSEYMYTEPALEMKRYIQHGRTTTYDHAMSVAYESYRIAYNLSLKLDYKKLVVCAFLHDFYLYDWHIRDESHRLHGFSHAEKAAENATRIYGIDEKARKIISSHMWPLNLAKIPTSPEAWVLTLADKAVSLRESVKGFFQKL